MRRLDGFWAGVWATLGLLLLGWLCWVSVSTVSHGAQISTLQEHQNGIENVIKSQLSDIQRRLERIENKLDEEKKNGG